MVRIYTLGGFNEVGKNMTACQIGKKGENKKGEDAIIFDAGLYLPPIVELEEKEKVYTTSKLRTIGALPDDSFISHLKDKVRAILVSHAHLDHVGAVPYMSDRYRATIMGTPFTTSVLDSLLADQNIKLRNNIKTIQPNSSVIVNGKKKYKVDFINMTHSTLQTSFIVLHTDKGAIVYANDFKLDNNPIVGKKPNYEAIKKVARQGVLALVVDSLYAGSERKTPSEKIARGLLEDVMLSVENSNSAIVVTTFSSHIARLKSIVDFGKQLNRKVVFVGRSLNKYVTAAKKVKLCPFSKDISIASYRNQVISLLKKVNKNRKQYLVVCTGHQGEPGSVLDRLSKNETPFSFKSKDHVIFSSKTIPNPINIANRKQLEKRLKQRGVRIFDEVHVSGHAGREDLRDLLTMLNPQHIIPAHGDLPKLSAMAELASELGYKLGSQCHIMQDSQHVDL